MPRNSLDLHRPAPLKAELKVNASQCALTAVVRDGLIAACGSLKNAAIDMETDAGQLTRDLQSGAFNFQKLARLDDVKRAKVIAHLHNEVMPLSTPQARFRQLVRDTRKHLDEIEQLGELLA